MSDGDPAVAQAAASTATGGFRHVDAARTIVFGPGAIDAAADLLGEGYTLLTTPRASGAAPSVVDRARAVVEVPAGLVEVVAADLRASVRGDRLVALGGGRVIDVAKSLAAADGPRQVVAIPTSLSGAEMTGGHRHALGVPGDTPFVRAAVVVNDPALSASQPPSELAASSANALGHAATGLLSDRSTPISRAVAGDAIGRIAAAWSGDDPDREALALGALLAAWAMDQCGLGPHHALAQSAVRAAGLGHAQANAALLPATLRAARRRRSADIESLDRVLGAGLETVAEKLRERAGADLGGLATDDELLAMAVEAAAARPELDRIPPAPDRAEIRGIYRPVPEERSAA